MDPAKLKVVELRAELAQRGLDTKGIKAALVKRLKDALEEETKEEIADTSIADTSTEDADVSQAEEAQEESGKEETEPEAEAEPDEPKVASPVKSKQRAGPLCSKKPAQVKEADDEADEPDKPKADAEPAEADQPDEGAKVDEGQENGDQEEPKRKSRWGNEEAQEEPQQMEEDSSEQPPKEEEAPKIEGAQTEDSEQPKAQQQGEKRKRSGSASPEPQRPQQRRRSKTPIKEDEPTIDNGKVQLSWYDSDLHLQVDKESFLSAKPLHEGAFGYAWAGVRATHGVSSGKVCYEVKITEELKFEDFTKYYHEKNRRESRHKSDHKKSEHDSKKDDGKKKAGDSNAESDESKKATNGDTATVEIKDGDDEEKPADEAEKEKPMEVDAAEAKPQEDEKPAEDKPAEEAKAAEDAPVEEAKAAEEDKPADADEKKDEEKASTEENKEEDKEESAAAEENKDEEKPEAMETEEIKEPVEPIPSHLFRVGWSLLGGSLQLGEEKHSYGYESSGKFVHDKEFEDYGVKFAVGDVVTALLDIGDEVVTISYAVNGEVQPAAIAVPKSELPEGFAFFPHVLSRNYAFEFNLGAKEEPWFAKPEDFEFLDAAEDKVAGPLRPEARTECEVILMCGIPASGKTHWVKEHIEATTDKKYTILGNTHFLERMTVSGSPLKSKFKGSWNMLLDKLQKSLNKLIDMAALRRRNYILDQPNVFPSAQRRKLRPFEGFKRRAVVVVVGDEEQAKRQSLQEAQGGKDVPDSAVLEMKANMSLPQKGDWLDEVTFVGVEEAEAKTIIQKYNTVGREAGYGGPQKRFGHRDDRHRWQNKRNDYRGGNYRDNRSYHNNRYDSRGPPRHQGGGGNWQPSHRPSGGGGGGNWNRDRRDNRGPPMGGGGGGGSRDWRNNRGSGRDNRDSRGSQASNYNRNQNRSGGRPGGNWQSGGGGGSWGGGGNQGQWGQGGWGGQGQWSGGGQGWNQNQWKYGGGGNQGYGYGQNWNYYGQYAQNWNASQGQQAQSASSNTTSSSSTANTTGQQQQQYGQQYSQQDWAQYAQQYAQQGQTSTAAATQQTTPQN